MPISYGQVKGRKYTNVQPVYDPNNPKPTRYPAHVKNWSGALPSKPKPKQIEHGFLAYKNQGCRCDICKAANAEYSRKRRTAKGGA